jgi:hypothetical protein
MPKLVCTIFPMHQFGFVFVDHIVSSSWLRHRLRTDFAGRSGASRLARQIGVTTTTARAILKGSPEAALVKAAALYGFEPSPDHGDEWIKADRALDPKSVGYRVWTDDMIDDAVQRLRAGRSCAVVAKHMGVTAGSLYRVLGRRKISLRALRGEAA